MIRDAFGKLRRAEAVIIVAGMLSVSPTVLAQQAAAGDGSAQGQSQGQPAEPQVSADTGGAGGQAQGAAVSTAAPVAGDQSGSAELGAVVVTAQKRPQQLKDVPMSMSALTGKKLEEEGEKTFTDYAQTVPSVNFGTFTEGQNRINIRGMQGISGSATVAYFVDGVAQSLDTGSPDNELFDVNRVEVLRGPQGTLYGEGAVGGAIKIVTNAPDPSGFAARVQSSLSDNSQGAVGKDIDGMINVPLIQDRLAFRAVLTRRSTDGYITVREPDFDNSAVSTLLGVPLKNYSSQNIVANDGNDSNVQSGRLGLTWYPTGSHDLEISARYNVQLDALGWATAISPSLQPRYGTYNQTEGNNAAATEATNLAYRQGNFTINWHQPSFSVESITGYADLDINNLIPAFVVVPLAPGANLGDLITTALKNNHRYVSQELRLASPDDDRLKWTAGVYYKTTSSDIFSHQIPGPVFQAIDPTNSLGLDAIIAANQGSREYAFYGQAEYALTTQWSMIIGGRYYHDDYTTVYPGVNEIAPNFTNFSPKVGLSYHYTKDVLFYSTIASGFRSGGVNIPTISPAPTGFQQQFNPDKVLSYELGVNSVFMDGKAGADAAVFYAAWRDFQEDLLLTNSNNQQETITSNAGRAHSAGVEFELTAALPLYTTGKLSGAYLNSQLDQDAPNPDLPNGVIPRGTRLENVPHWSGSFSLTQDYPINSNLKLANSVLLAYRGKTHADILDPDGSVSGSYALFNLRLGLKDRHNRWEASVFLNNVFDRLASPFNFQSSDTEFLLPPRTVGIRGSYSFF